MKRQLKLLCACIALAAFLSTAYGGVPSVDVTVFDASEKVVFKRAINANSAFATGNLRSGKYVVQFKSQSAALKNNQYLAVVSSGRKKVIAAAIPGERFMAGGAAMKIDVGADMRITGQLAREEVITNGTGPISRVVDGKRYVWVRVQTGTHIDGQWVEESLAVARSTTVWTADELRKRMDRAGEGSMITYQHHHHVDKED
jgi:hypothetical protein